MIGTRSPNPWDDRRPARRNRRRVRLPPVPNDTRNPAVRITDTGVCQWCHAYSDGYDRARLDRELDLVRGLVGSGTGRFDALVGLSGGKDFTATLVRAVELGFRPLGFTFDTGYYPPHIVPRARHAAGVVGVEHEVIDLHRYLRPVDVESFALTAALFDRDDSEDLARAFRRLYLLNRRRYSVRHGKPMAYVRTCQLCRRLVVRAYHREATRRGVRVVLLGTNEWVGLANHPAPPGTPSPRYGHCARPGPPTRCTSCTCRSCSAPTWPTPAPCWTGSAGGHRTGNSWSRPTPTRACCHGPRRPRPPECSASTPTPPAWPGKSPSVGFLTRQQASAALADPHEHSASVRQVLNGCFIKFCERRWCVMHRDAVEQVPVIKHHRSKRSFTNPRGVLQHGPENRSPAPLANELMTCSTSEVAVCCSSASVNSFRAEPGLRRTAARSRSRSPPGRRRS